MIEPTMKFLAEKYTSKKLICRKCYARLNNKAKNCRKCNSKDLREKKQLR